MSAEEFQNLSADLTANGFDSSQPIVIYENAILDGWNRFRACQTLDIPYVERQFHGTPFEAINFVMRTNKRRNLTSQQLAVIAVESEEIVNILREETERERREQQAETLKETHEKGEFGVCVKKLTQTNEEPEETEIVEELTYEIETPFQPKTPNKNRVTTKLAKTFGTNRTYVSEALKLKETAPEKLEQVKSGETTFQQIKKEEKAILSETPVIPNGNGTDDFTKLLARHGTKLLKTFENFEAAMSEVWTDFKKHEKKFSEFAPVIDGFNRGYAPEKLVDLKNQAALLRRYVQCPNCQTSGCVWCKEKGYVRKSEVEAVKGATK